MLIPLLIIVTGPPGGGKTTLAKRLAADLSLPLVTKDAIKERLYDRLGVADLEAARELGRASYDLLYDFSESILAAGQSVIAESNFAPQWASPVWQAMRERHPFRVLQIRCSTSATVLYQRVLERVARGERHHAHRDAEAWESVGIEKVAASAGLLDLEGEILDLDTTDFALLDYDAILALARRVRESPDQPENS